MLVCWVMTAQVTFQAKGAVLEVLFGGPHSEVVLEVQELTWRAVLAPEELGLAVEAVLFEMGLGG